jgi:hypothetical protein
MNTDLVNKLIVQVRNGEKPVIVLVPKRGTDVRRVRLLDHHQGSFIGEFADESSDAVVRISDDVLRHGGFNMEAA